MPEQNVKQAWVLPSGEALENPVGTAPGWFVRIRNGEFAGKSVVALPGPPHEMKRMWTDQVLPRLELPASGLYTHTFRTFAIGESHIAERLGAALTQSSNPSVATYARRDGVHVRVAASGATPEAAQALAGPVETAVLAALEGHVYGTDDETLASVVGRLLTERSETVATLESLTGGLVADELTNVPGASRSMLGGAVAYTNPVKVLFGVRADTLESAGAVSRETAIELAEAARARFSSTWGVATTGVAGPEPSEGKPVGLVYVAVAGPDGSHAAESMLSGDRRVVKERAAIAALGMLWRRLSSREPV